MQKNYDVRIHYLYHSGFALEFAEHFIVFDYFKGDIARDDTSATEGRSVLARLVKYKNVLVMVSHGHQDHFNPMVFEWSNTRLDMDYIISDDVDMVLYDIKHTLVKPNDRLNVGGVKINVFGSTDLGVSFLVEVNGIRVFHAGDLNWWHWAGESTEQELREAERFFKEQVSYIADKPIDIMFFPVDPRLEEHYYLGGEYMIKKFKPKLFIPMHFGSQFDITKEFAKKMGEQTTECVTINKKSQVIEYKNHNRS